MNEHVEPDQEKHASSNGAFSYLLQGTGGCDTERGLSLLIMNVSIPEVN